jgi:hypothetical protein
MSRSKTAPLRGTARSAGEAPSFRILSGKRYAGGNLVHQVGARIDVESRQLAGVPDDGQANTSWPHVDAYRVPRPTAYTSPHRHTLKSRSTAIRMQRRHRSGASCFRCRQ